jgi:geranylgeranyl pyrophosphate synthase
LARDADFLAACCARVDADLDKQLPAASEPPTTLHEAMRYAVFSGGKRLRPALAYAAAIAGGAPPECANPIASAAELLHAYSLVHDDLPAMDDDDLRRGRPTVHVRFGEAIAILTGDALLTAAFGQLGREGVPAGATARLAEAAGSRNLVGGQADDLGFARASATPEDITSIHARKTAALFRFALWGGGSSANADASVLARLDAFGLAYGLAFQLIDDLGDAGRADECSMLAALAPEAVRARAAGLCAGASCAAAVLGERGWALTGLAKALEGRLP